MEQEKFQNHPVNLDLSSGLFDWAEAIVTALATVVLFFTFIARLIGVDGSSMFPTLRDGDQLIVASSIFQSPKQGDIVVLTKNSFLSSSIVKRVIAVGGQEININFDTHQVFVDGIELDEPYINEPTETEGTMEFPQTVPEGYIFVMGDNRNHSTDSRYTQLGMVDERYVIGKVIFRLFPFDRLGTVD